ncbi:hypothetical protein N9358_03180, partial [Flavobacteriales bacterium]|nr:hypothetical protein [Flavobacteriales bacterium]
DSVYTVVDWIGDWNGAPSGGGWDVCGISAGTKDHTLVRKSSVTSGNSDWASSAGTNADDCEWIVLEQNDWTNLGSHTMDVVSSCTDITITLFDSYGDGGGSVVVDGVTYALAIASGAEESFSACVDISCLAVDYVSTDSYSYENSWSISDASGVLVSGDNADGLLDNGGCITACTDETAENYNADADISDDSLCEYSCDGTLVTITLFDSYGDGGGSVIINGETYELLSLGEESFTACLDLSACQTVTYAATDSWSYENSWSISDDTGVLASGADEDGYLGNCVVACTDDAACNYTPDADVSDISLCSYANTNADCDGNCLEGFTLVQGAGGGNGSGGGNGGGACVAIVEGCTDATASNYNAEANTNNGSCTLTITTTVCNNPSSVRLTGPWWGWDPNGGPEAADNGDGTWTVELPNMTAAMEYLMVVDGVQENLIGAGDCTPITDGANYANRQWLPGDSYTLANVYGSCDDPATFECPTEISGCTDSTASNYNASAEIDNESCLYTVTFNVDMNCYDQPFVNVHWVSIWTDWGVGENNWNQMTDSDGDGIYTYTHLNDVPFGHNYKFMVDGVHENLIGAGDCAPSTDGATYANRVVSSTIEDGVFASCEDCVPVPGCTDAAACNYNVEATEDDLSCTYAAEGFDCEGNCIAGTAVVYTSGNYAIENSFTISDCDGNVLAEMTSGTMGFNSCVVLGDNYVVDLVDSYGDGWNGGSLTIGGVTYTIDDAAENNDTYSEIVGSCGVPGCIDAAACNYNADATFDDGSCDLPLTGYDCEGN